MTPDELKSYLGPYIDPAFDRVIDCPHLYLPGGHPEIVSAYSLAALPHPELVKVFTQARHLTGEPLLITSGARCAACQAALNATDLKISENKNPALRTHAAKVSEHVPQPVAAYPDKPTVFAAFDLQPAKWKTRDELQDKLEGFVFQLGELNPAVRVGLDKYRHRARPIVHIGVGYLLKPNPDPINFIEKMRW